MFALPVSMPPFKSIFIKIVLKLSYFFKKMQNFRTLGAPPQYPVPPAAEGTVLRPQNSPLPHSEFLAMRLRTSRDLINYTI